jgi:hypothetical protein
MDEKKVRRGVNEWMNQEDFFDCREMRIAWQRRKSGTS